MCSGKRRGRAALRRFKAVLDKEVESALIRENGQQRLAALGAKTVQEAQKEASIKVAGYLGQDEVYEQTLPPGPFKGVVFRGCRFGRTKRPRKAPEASFQIQVARYLAKALPPGYVWTTFPSGGGGRIRGARLKQQGLKPGMPDMVVFEPWENWMDKADPANSPVLWLELKAKSGSLSQAQKDVHKQLKALGHQVDTCRTLEQVQHALADFCFPEKLRARVTV